MSWLNTGYGSLKTEEKRQSEAQQPNRFWVPIGERREFVFVDDEPGSLYEHNPKLNGNWRNWLTCLKDVNEAGCPACEILGEKTRYLAGYYTVVDVSKWTDKKGNVHQFEIVFFPAKYNTVKKLQRKKADAIEAGRTLATSLYRASRDGDKEPAVGSEFEFIRVADMDRLFEVALYRGKKISELYDKADADPAAMEALKRVFQLQMDGEGKIVRKLFPFNYFELLHPRSRKEMEVMVRGAKGNGDEDRGGSSSEGMGSSGDEDVPF